MCVIAGYIGNKPASPVLLEMLRREEGLAGGYYSGVVTLHEGKLHCAKVVGDVATLLKETDAWNLPGSIGLAHSRTPGGGGQAWAHPFIDTRKKVAYIANGGYGPYDGRVDFTAAAARLLARGYEFETAQAETVTAKYPCLPDGRWIHVSDLLCQSIAAACEDEASGEERLLNAASAVYQELPSCIVGLCLHVEHPDEIVGVRHNKPMDIGRLRDGSLVMASGALAFPEGVDWEMRLPALTGVRFERNGRVTLRPFTNQALIPVGAFPSAEKIEQALVAPLREAGVKSVNEIVQASVPLYPAGVLDEKEVIAFGLLRALRDEGRIELFETCMPGMEGKGTVPKSMVRWVG